MATIASQKTADPSPQLRQIRFVHNHGQPSKRRRINAACLTCRRRKTRCSGERPLCTTCIKNGHRCLGYGEEGKREGGDASDARPEQETDEDYERAIDDRNDYGGDLKDTVITKKRTHTASSTQSSFTNQPPSPQARDQSDGASSRSKVTGSAAEDNRPPSEGTTSPIGSRQRRQHRQPQQRAAQMSQEQAISDDTPGSPTLRRSLNHRVPYFRYFGPTAIVPGFKQMVVFVRDRRRSFGGSHSGGSPLSTPTNNLANSSVAGSDVVTEDLPAYDPNDPAPVHPLIISLVQTFFVHLGCNYPFLNRKKFMRLLREKRVEPILVDAICALSGRFSDAPLLSGVNDKIPRTERGQVFAQRAKQATVDTFPAPSVGAVQACLLMAYEGFGANQDSALWMYLGLAIRMAVDLGLQKRIGIQYQGEKDPWYTRHRSLVSGASESPEEKRHDAAEELTFDEQREVEQERIDTFWAVFILDRVISSGTGRPVTFREDDFDLPFPERVIDAATGWPDPFPVFVEIVHLYGRVSDVLNKIRNVQDLTEDKWSKLIKMETQLTRLYKNWDPRLQFNVNNFKKYVRFGQGTTFILLHFWFHALFIVLHQPTLMAPFGDLRSELQLLSESRELSMSSAKTICDILAFADLIDPKSFIGNPFTSQPMYIAACAFLMESSANASEATSREGSPRGDRSKDQHGKSASAKHSRHSLLASAASQNYQRCYNSLQHLHVYWGGVKYILTALDQKAKGIWDCETYTTEEYESTKVARREQHIGSPFPRFDNHASPMVTGPPIAWSLAGTANSPNSSLTLMYQNLNGSMPPEEPMPVAAAPRHASTPPGNMVYDPIRQSLPQSGVMLPPAVPQPNMSAMRTDLRRSASRRMSGMAEPTAVGTPTIEYDGMSEDADGPKMFIPSGYPTPGPHSAAYDTYVNSPRTSMADANAQAQGMVPPLNGATTGQDDAYYHARPDLSQSVPWGIPLGNMDAITFDSQDIDIAALGLQQPELMAGWIDYLPGDVLSLFENQDMGQGQGQGQDPGGRT